MGIVGVVMVGRVVGVGGVVGEERGRRRRGWEVGCVVVHTMIILGGLGNQARQERFHLGFDGHG